MSSELRLSQFRYVVTNNNDFVIGDPSDSSTDPRVLTFQVNTTPGYDYNPHIRAQYVTDHWELRWSHDGTTLSGFAMLNSPNTFTDSNNFEGNVTLGNTSSDTLSVAATSTFSSPVIINSDLTVTGNTSYLHVTNLATSDKNILLNKGGSAASASQSGFDIEENSVVTGYFRTSADRSAFEFKTPASLGTIAFTPNNYSGSYLQLRSNATTSRLQYLPDKDGTVALIEDLGAVISGFTAGRALVTSGTGTIIASSVTSTEVSYLSGVTSAIQTQINAKANLSGATFTGTISGPTANFTTMTGDHRGALSGRNLPSPPGSGEDGYVLKYNNSTASWILGPMTVAGSYVTTDTTQSINAVKTFNQPLVISTVTGTGGGDHTSYIDMSFSDVTYGTATARQRLDKYGVNDIWYNLNLASGYDFYLRRRSDNHMLLQLTGGVGGSSIYMKDVANGSNYRLYFNNGILTQGT